MEVMTTSDRPRDAMVTTKFAQRMRAVIFLVIGFAAGTLFFAIFSGDPEPAAVPPPVKVTVTKEVPGPTKTVTKKVIPESCLAMIDSALRAQQAVQEYEAQVGALPDLLDAAGTAVGAGDTKKLNELREKDVKLEADSIQSLLNIRDAQQRMKINAPKCQKALKGE